MDPKYKTKNTFIEVCGSGNFFDDGQHTVFLKCHSDRLKQIWKKADYGYNPHITLYDGNSSSFARKLNVILEDLNLHFACAISKLYYVTSPKGQKRLDLLSCLDDKHFKEVTGFLIKPEEMYRLSDDERLKLISMLAAKLPELAEKAYGEVDGVE